MYGVAVQCKADDCHILRNRITRHGQLGISAAVNSGTLAGFVLDSNEIDHNNTAGWTVGFSGGGMKLVRTSSALIRHNHIHDNAGSGVWCDIDNENCRVQANVVADNAYQGIMIEISYGALIDSNTVTGNGYGRANVFCFGAGS